tara:strand:+ start:608 stop:727 length:120 start_codon:yes stop_codon:yes gene_type:complete
MTPEGETLFNLFKQMTEAQLKLLGIDTEESTNEEEQEEQ